jgi:hypothetical protein
MKWLKKLISSEPRSKQYALPRDQVKQLVYGYGGCVASDMITVDGKRVGFMYRSKPVRDVDSGWRFLSGFENDEYMANNKNHDVYDLNTIANYDQDIISLLESPVGSVFERPTVGAPFVPVHDWKFPEGDL